VIFSLDTNVMIDIVNDRQPVRGRFDEAVEGGGVIFACPLAAHELVFGSLISARPQYQLTKARALLRDLRMSELTLDDCLVASDVRRDLRKRGQSIGAYDLMIAAQAMNRGWTVVSHNLREYVRVEGLAVVDWTQPDPPQQDQTHA